MRSGLCCLKNTCEYLSKDNIAYRNATKDINDGMSTDTDLNTIISKILLLIIVNYMVSNNIMGNKNPNRFSKENGSDLLHFYSNFCFNVR